MRMRRALSRAHASAKAVLSEGGAARRRRSSAAEPQKPAGGAPADAAAAEAAAQAERARALEEAKLSLANSSMLFPWERSAFGDRTVKLAWWQKAYWVAFGCVGVYWAGEKCYNKATTGKWHGDPPPPRPGAKVPRPKPTLLKSRVNDALKGGNFASDEDGDPFEGLTPAEIAALVEREAPGGDAFDGMSPEEIEDYVRREEAERLAADAIVSPPPPQPPPAEPAVPQPSAS